MEVLGIFSAISIVLLLSIAIGDIFVNLKYAEAGRRRVRLLNAQAVVLWILAFAAFAYAMGVYFVTGSFAALASETIVSIATAVNAVILIGSFLWWIQRVTLRIQVKPLIRVAINHVDAPRRPRDPMRLPFYIHR